MFIIFVGNSLLNPVVISNIIIIDWVENYKILGSIKNNEQVGNNHVDSSSRKPVRRYTLLGCYVGLEWPKITLLRFT